MKNKLNFLFFCIAIILFSGCSFAPKEKLEPIGDKFKFEKITFNFEQAYSAKNIKYQSSESIEKKLNFEIINNLNKHKLIDNNSQEKLLIDIEFKRVFVGEAFGKFGTEKIANPFLSYNIKILNKNNQVVRNKIRNRLMFDAGIIGNLKAIALLNDDDELENDAITAFGKYIAREIQNLK